MLQGEASVGEFYSVAVTNNRQQADTGTKMIHIGKNTKSTIVAKGISAGQADNTYRGLVRMLPTAHGARNHTQCDSLLMGDRCGAHTFPTSNAATPPLRSSMRRRPQRSPTTSCSTAAPVGCRRKTR